MRKSIVIAVSLLFVVASAFAQQRATPSNTVSVFISDAVVSYSSSSGSRLDASYGGAFDHMFNRHISAEVSLTSQPARRYFSTFVTNGQPVTSSSTVHFHPIDASISYHFLTDSRWKPYLGGGLRYLNNSVILTGGPLGNQRLTTRTVDPHYIPGFKNIVGAGSRIRPFIELTGNFDGGHGSDSIQTYFGLNFDLDYWHGNGR